MSESEHLIETLERIVKKRTLELKTNEQLENWN